MAGFARWPAPERRFRFSLPRPILAGRQAACREHAAFSRKDWGMGDLLLIYRAVGEEMREDCGLLVRICVERWKVAR